MTVRGSDMYNNHKHTIYIFTVLSPLNHMSYVLPFRAISWKVQNGLKWNLVY